MTVSDEYTELIHSLKNKLPSLPKILQDLISRLSNPDSNLDQVEELVQIDQAITAQILKVSNKIEFLEPHEPRIVTIHDALHKIGYENAKRIALNFSVLKIMRITKFPTNFCCEDLWQHSLGVAVAASVISERLGLESPDQAYACGLIHDLGKLVKVSHNYRGFSKEIASAYRKDIDMHDLEIRRGLLRHDFLGYYLLDIWQMPKQLKQVVKWHHTESKSDRIDVECDQSNNLIDIVFLSNLLTNKLKIGYSGHRILKKPSDKFLRSLNLKEEDLESIEIEIRETYEHSCPALLIL